MRRSLLLSACLITIGGCQATAPPTTPVSVSTTHPVAEYDAVVASALVFDPPVVQDEPELELGRAEREPRVSMGFDGPITEYFSIRLDDRQISNGWGISGASGHGSAGSFDRYERRAVTERVGVRYR
jgi:hypothetical protein